MVRAGKDTYFFDVKTATNGKKYLTITGSRFVGEGKEHERSKIIVFAEAIAEFVEAVNQAAKEVESSIPYTKS